VLDVDEPAHRRLVGGQGHARRLVADVDGLGSV
jgi:hypothetical protein